MTRTEIQKRFLSGHLKNVTRVVQEKGTVRVFVNPCGDRPEAPNVTGHLPSSRDNKQVSAA